jgi:hypothetical protein
MASIAVAGIVVFSLCIRQFCIQRQRAKDVDASKELISTPRDLPVVAGQAVDLTILVDESDVATGFVVDDSI